MKPAVDAQIFGFTCYKPINLSKSVHYEKAKTVAHVTVQCNVDRSRNRSVSESEHSSAGTAG